MKHITIKDIARSLCVSVSTVSRALTGDKNIRRETREMIVEEARRLGYKRNPVAMNLKMGRTNTIGVIVPEMHTPYAATVVNGIQEVLYKKNQKVMIAESDENPDRELENLEMMEQFMVDGLIVSLCSYRRNMDMYLSPQITTMEPPLEEMGRRAAELVMEKINNPLAENKTVVLKTTMQCRESTGE